MTGLHSKLELDGPRLAIAVEAAEKAVIAILKGAGCAGDVARQVARHLVDASLCGVESHGIMRVLQYAGQMQRGYMDARGSASVASDGLAVDGDGGIGIPAMDLAYEVAAERARETGMAAVAVRNLGHTGRHGAFAEAAAAPGIMTICLGGGNRETWRQVAPHGGAKALLPTNPWCIGLPGGERGPVVLDFATSQIAGGWIYAARSAGALLPEGCVIDRDGRPTRDPEDYFEGGAILPSGGHKGYGLALVGEMVAEALLGPVAVEANWLVLAIDTTRFGDAAGFRARAEAILSEMRSCPPAPGSSGVEIPGERERVHREAAKGVIQVPERTWEEISTLAASGA